MIFVSGMFRSGTTFIARVLNKHKDIAFASDPFFAIFKDFRNTLAENVEFNRNTDAPLEDYYFHKNQNAFFHELQGKNLSEVLIPDLDHLKEFTFNSARPYSPLLAEKFCEIKAVNYDEFIQEAALLLNQTYGPATNIGFKEVWANEFTPHVLRSFPGKAKVIHIVRDPRAITVSNFYSEGRYPLLFLGRQWRKIAGLSVYYSEHSKNSIIIKYEDLISNPEIVLKRVCHFLGVAYDPNLLNTEDIKDGGNQKWTQNSTFQEKQSGFNQNSINRWREKISINDQKAIEFLCLPEMKFLGYTPDYINSENWNSFSAENLIDQKEKLASWIKDFSEFNYKEELTLEKKRLNYLAREPSITELQLNFLYPEIYNHLRNAFFT